MNVVFGALNAIWELSFLFLFIIEQYYFSKQVHSCTKCNINFDAHSKMK